MNEKGVLFSTDLLLSLIILSVLIGISCDLMDLNREISHKNLQMYYMERVVGETADILINSPGSPENWENLTDSNVIPGLSSKNSDVLSYDKICKLKSNPGLLTKILPPGVHVNITIYPKNVDMSPIIIKSENQDASEIFIVNRTVQCDFFKKYVVLEINSTSRGCYIHPNTWRCGYFRVTPKKLEKNDYYLLGAENSHISWILDTPRNRSDIENQESFILLNDKIDNLLSSDPTGVIWLHSRGDGKILIVEFPKNATIPTQIAYFQIQICDFVMTAWI